MSFGQSEGLDALRARGATDVASSDALSASAADAANKEAEIIELLVAAGYFRARITGLTTFDKVVGGMAWCMTASSVEVDVVFVENASIGQKIKIGESIERALVRMKCPHPLQAHQIQGLDYGALFPVVQWLVKRAYTFREEIAEAMRRSSVRSFDHTALELPADAERGARRRVALPAARRVCAGYTPLRRYKPKKGTAAANASAAMHARRVLIEFGEQLAALGAAAAALGTEDDAKAAGGAAGDADAALRSAMSEMAAAEEGELSKQTVGSLVGMGAAAIAQAAVTFAQKSEELAASGEMAGVMRLRAERRAVEAQLEAEGRALAALEAEAAEAEAARAEAEARLAAAKGKRAEQLELMGKAEEEMAKLRELEAKLPPDVLKELHALVAKVDALKEQQKEFKAKCKEEYAAMEAKRAAQLSGGGDDDDRRVAEIEKLYDAEHAKVLQMRRLAGQKGRQIAALQRQVDEIPNRAELLQYERRFRELYAMIAQKGDETRKYYAMYNVLEEKKTYVTKEISLINSIHENFTKVMAEKAAAREKLAESVDSTVKSVQATRAKTQARVDDELAAKAALQAKYDKLLGQQRKYFKLVKELKEAYQKQAEAEDAKAAAASGGA